MSDAMRTAGLGPTRLAKDATLRLDPGRRGLVLRSLAGTVLATQSGDPLDHVVEAGGAVRLGGRGRVVVWALEPASLAVEAG